MDTIEVIIHPTSEPVTLAEVKAANDLDLAEESLTVEQLIAPDRYFAGVTTSDSVEIAGYQATIITSVGEITDGGVAIVELQHSLNGSNGWITYQTFEFEESGTAEHQYSGDRSFLRVVVTVDDGTGGEDSNEADLSIMANLSPLAGFEDDKLSRYITTAREYAEERTNRKLMTQTVRYTTHRFPSSGIKLKHSPIQSVTITYLDSSNQEQELEAGAYSLVGDVVYPTYGTSWPSALDYPGSVVVEYVAGYDSASAVPVKIKQAICIMAAGLYEYPQGDWPPIIMNTVDNLLEGHRLRFKGSE